MAWRAKPPLGVSWEGGHEEETGTFEEEKSTFGMGTVDLIAVYGPVASKSYTGKKALEE